MSPGFVSVLADDLSNLYSSHPIPHERVASPVSGLAAGN
ncbi:MAG: hypothetical protein J07HX64_02922 [halophilic archaeon J07HX64]|nr:MAG: hypothetical protein J07HX64_02922 [halophilic archaeon J07HX64]